jgi:hypothetical protein
MKPIRTIGIVNGGGDAPGLNPVIRAIVRASINEHGMRVVGVLNGFDGLIWLEGAKEMTEESVSGILPRGGTILGTTNRGNPFAYKAMENGQEVIHDYSSLCMDNARRLGIDAMIVIGGDGTQHIARDFYRKGGNIVGVPKTIDNDLDATEVTFGFDTALSHRHRSGGSTVYHRRKPSSRDAHAAQGDSRHRARPRTGRRLANAFRSYPRHALWSLGDRPGCQRGVWADGLPESWQNGFSIA